MIFLKRTQRATLIKGKINLTPKPSELSLVEGDLTGVARFQWNMYYNHFNEDDRQSSVASYLGLVRFEGNIQGSSQDSMNS